MLSVLIMARLAEVGRVFGVRVLVHGNVSDGCAVVRWEVRG